MESPKVGIIILALVAAASLIGGMAGWQIRLQGTSAESMAITLPAKTGQ